MSRVARPLSDKIDRIALNRTLGIPIFLAADLAVHFDTDREAMRGMLQQWVQKGRVTRSRPQAG